LVTLKRQIGVRIDGLVWLAYRELCSRERLRPADGIEMFLRFVVGDGSVVSVLNWLKTAGKVEGLEAYARVLLNWYAHGERWMYITDEDEAPIEPMLLSALKEVSDPELRKEIEEALWIKPAKKKPSKKQVKAVEEIAEKLEQLKKIRT